MTELFNFKRKFQKHSKNAFCPFKCQNQHYSIDSTPIIMKVLRGVEILEKGIEKGKFFH